MCCFESTRQNEEECLENIREWNHDLSDIATLYIDKYLDIYIYINDVDWVAPPPPPPPFPPPPPLPLPSPLTMSLTTESSPPTSMRVRVWADGRMGGEKKKNNEQKVPNKRKEEKKTSKKV